MFFGCCLTMKWRKGNASHSGSWRAAGSFPVTSIAPGSLIQSVIFGDGGRAPLRVCGAHSSTTNEMWLSDCSWDYKGLGWGPAEGGPSLDINYSHCQISPSSKGCEGHRGGARRLQVQSTLIVSGPTGVSHWSCCCHHRNHLDTSSFFFMFSVFFKGSPSMFQWRHDILQHRLTLIKLFGLTWSSSQ